jgi:uncharacterized BrkB/YihY/UPF0761 family membrane protein
MGIIVKLGYVAICIVTIVLAHFGRLEDEKNMELAKNNGSEKAPELSPMSIAAIVLGILLVLIVFYRYYSIKNKYFNWKTLGGLGALLFVGWWFYPVAFMAYVPTFLGTAATAFGSLSVTQQLFVGLGFL